MLRAGSSTFDEGLQNDTLVLLLSEHAAPPVPIQILYVANRLLPKRAIAFMDFIAATFSTVPALNARLQQRLD